MNITPFKVNYSDVITQEHNILYFGCKTLLLITWRINLNYYYHFIIIIIDKKIFLGPKTQS